MILQLDRKNKKKGEKKKNEKLVCVPSQAIFFLRKLAGSQHNHDVSQWEDSHKNKETKCLPVLTDE